MTSVHSAPKRLLMRQLGLQKTLVMTIKLRTRRNLDRVRENMAEQIGNHVQIAVKKMPPTRRTLIAKVIRNTVGPEALEYGSFADSNFRLAMTAGVAVGATEVQLNLIASRFLGLPRE